MPTLAPRVAAIPVEADAIAPGRRTSSDGGYVDKPGGHNIGARDLVHAYDIGQSMPGTPYWEPQFEQFDVWALCYRIAAEYIAATDAERQRRWPWLYDGGYMVWFDGTKDIIFGPKHDRDLGQAPHIRQNGDFKTEHFQHAHFEAAETIRAEQDTQPIFAPEDDVTPAEMDAIVNRTVAGVVKRLGRQPDGSPGLIGDEVAHVLGGYPDGKHYEDGSLIERWRKDSNQSKRP